MEAERLKVIAIGMGREDVSILNNIVTIKTKRQFCNHGVYNPLTNAEQDSEIEIKLETLTTCIRKDLWQATIYEQDKVTPSHEGRGETPSKARANAAYEYFKENNNV